MGNVSPTQRSLTPAAVERLVAASFDEPVRVLECSPLAGGGFAAVWWARLDDGRAVVLKVGPPPEVPVLRYERDLMAAEARCFRLARRHTPEVPVPEVLCHGTDRTVIDADWLVTTALPGRTLRSLTETEPGLDDSPARVDSGRALAALHRIAGPAFGYDGGRTGAATWPDAFAAIVADLLADAADWSIKLPVGPAVLEDTVDRHRDALAEVDRPTLVYFDAWDGNLLVQPGPDGVLRLCGIVDGERFLYGDPLMDFVQPAMYRRIEDEPEHPFRRGHDPVEFDPAARRRLALYRLHLYLLMLVEMPSRGMTDPARADRLTGHLATQVRALEG